MPETPNQQAVADRSPTEAFVRDLYALAAWYSAHPEYPRPRAVQVHHHSVVPAALDQLAEQYRTDPYGEEPRIMHHWLPGAVTPVNMIVAERVSVRS